jgi:arylsulfatase A-like enzyme
MFEDAKLPRKVMEKNEIKNKPSEAYDYINDRLKWPFKTDELTDRQIEGTKKNYYSLNTLIDDWIGEIINTLKQRGIYEDTIIIYSSDHGDLLGDHGLVYKQCFYEQSVKVPLIVCCPKRFKKGRSDALVESLDLYKTIIDMGCAEPTQKTHSKSLMPVLQGERQHHREYVVSENYFGNMIRNKRFKMVYYKGKPYGELYDLINDHQEFVNLWDDEKYNAAKTDLKEKLLDWYAKTAETGLNPVRGNHFDKTPLEYEMKDGAANLIANQSWQLSFMREFYESF